MSSVRIQISELNASIERRLGEAAAHLRDPLVGDLQAAFASLMDAQFSAGMAQALMYERARSERGSERAPELGEELAKLQQRFVKALWNAGV